jgi:chromosome segregation ATPase
VTIRVPRGVPFSAVALPDDLEQRVSALERQMAELRERVALANGDADAARVLAAGADRDVGEVRAELRAHTRALSALRETQVEFQQAQLRFGAELQAQHAELQEQRVELVALDGRVRDGFATMSAGMSEITRLLERIARGE